MLVGVGLPFLLLACYEVYAILHGNVIRYPDDTDTSQDDVGEIGSIQNLYGLKVLAASFITIGFIFLALAIWAENAAIYLIVAGLSIMALGILLYAYVKTYTQTKRKV